LKHPPPDGLKALSQSDQFLVVPDNETAKGNLLPPLVLLLRRVVERQRQRFQQREGGSH
jgi:hypothetical protein